MASQKNSTPKSSAAPARKPARKAAATKVPKNSSTRAAKSESDEGAVPEASARRKGSELIEAIRIRQRDLGLDQKGVANILDISPNHLSFLMSGARWWGTVDPDKLFEVAKFLDASPAAVYMMAEILTPEDFIPPNEIDKVIEHVGRTIMTDPQMPGMIGGIAEWNALPMRWRVVISLLYQELHKEQMVSIHAKAQKMGLT